MNPLQNTAKFAQKKPIRVSPFKPGTYSQILFDLRVKDSHVFNFAAEEKKILRKYPEARGKTKHYFDTMLKNAADNNHAKIAGIVDSKGNYIVTLMKREKVI